MPERVMIAMSGGVDSSVAAALLVEQGHEVSGVMMRLWAEGENRCCAPDAVQDAQRVADQLGIPFELVDYAEEFKTRVVDYFLSEYGQGRTPNPCLACNRHIRFGQLMNQARAQGVDYLATGHYARADAHGKTARLRAGADRQKDQSYVLYMLGQRELRHVLFPIGGFTKPEIRQMARERALSIAEKAESMELCFVADDDYRRFFREHAPHAVQAGPILDSSGRELGQHQGLPFYTIGQRRGLGIAAAEALYVHHLDVERNAVVVGPARELGRTKLVASDVNYVSGQAPEGPVHVQAKIRYRAALARATWAPLDGGRASVEFETPLRDITPGQAVVAYQEDVVLGGGTISE
jgi:tRNA-specific 2-thiouridylase